MPSIKMHNRGIATVEPEMKQTEWDQEARRLNRAINAGEKLAKNGETLKIKIEAQAVVKVLRESLRQHRLRYHELLDAN